MREVLAGFIVTIIVIGLAVSLSRNMGLPQNNSNNVDIFVLPDYNISRIVLSSSEYSFPDHKTFHDVVYSGYCGANITVALIDTGIDYRYFNPRNIKAMYSAIYNMVWTPKNGSLNQLFWYEIENFEEYPFLDQNGHGTAVASLINDVYVGVAPCTKLVIVKAFFSNATSKLEYIMRGLEWIYNNTEKYNIRIVSMSFGAPDRADIMNPLKDILKKIHDKGVILVASAGNFNPLGFTVSTPAIFDFVYSVGAWNCHENKLAYFTSVGKVDFVACGVNVTVKIINGVYTQGSGTSFSAPIIAGLIAQYLEKYDSFEVSKARIKKINIWFKDPITGYGILLAPS